MNRLFRSTRTFFIGLFALLVLATGGMFAILWGQRGWNLETATGLLVLTTLWFFGWSIYHLKWQQKKILRQHDHFARIVGKTALIGAWYVNPDDELPIWSDEVCALHDEPPGFQPTSQQAISYFAPEVRASVREVYERCQAEGVAFDQEFPLTTSKGREIWVRIIAEPVFSTAGKLIRVQGSAQDVTERRQPHDPLTGLPSRSLLRDRIDQASQIAGRNQHQLSVLYVDLDEFKPINDTLGHEVGDEILIAVAERLVSTISPGDTVARVSGDEFAVVLSSVTATNEVLVTVEHILQVIGEPYQVGQSDVRITASIGIALSSMEASSAMELVQQADLAMYKAKRRGRNTYQWYTQDLNNKVSARVALRNELSRALDNDEFRLVYQPQVNGISGRVEGVEALLRWQHPERGVILPGEFIGLAEDTGQIIAISDWVLNTALRDLQRLRKHSPHKVVMSVNVSPRQFQRDQFVPQLLNLLKLSDTFPGLLELELTEGLLMDKMEETITKLRTLNGEGVRIAIDNFGTGFSSMSYLKYLPVNKVKIDESFVRDLVTDHRDAAIIEGIVSMSFKLGLDVVAEGVETEAQQAYLLKQNVLLHQGFQAGRAMPLEELLMFLSDRTAAEEIIQERSSGQRGGQTLLLLDDELNVLRALTRVLRREGYQVLATQHVSEAFEWLATNRVQVVVSDQMMPEMNGTEFLARVKSMYPEVIQILLSGYTDLQTLTDAINEGGIHKFVTKPWDDDELRLVIRQAFQTSVMQALKDPAFDLASDD